MRIRSIHPEFWRSEDIGALDWETRLVFIGLWSYVDDNGVGRDHERLIIADLFPLEDDPRETLATVSRALATLSAGGQITRYTVAGKPFLHITAWDKWQRIDKPGKARYEPPTCTDAVIRESLATVSGESRETPAPGEGEKGRRGEDSSASADAEREFAEWWLAYPLKKDKGHAAKAYRAARRKVDAQTLLEAIRRQTPAFKPGFIPYAATWLTGERWQDEDPTEEADNGWHTPWVPPAAPPDIADDPERYAKWLNEQRAMAGR